MSLFLDDNEQQSASAEPRSWYVVRVKPKHEKKVYVALGNKGYEAFLPLFLARRQWQSASRQVQLPLFPHYVFCRMSAQRRTPVLEIPAVRAIVSFGRVPIPVDDSEVDAVRAMVDSGLPIAPHPFLAVGSRVTVTAGPLAGVEGVLEAIRGQYRLVVCIALLRRSVSVEIDRHCVVPSAGGGSIRFRTERTSHLSPSSVLIHEDLVESFSDST